MKSVTMTYGTMPTQEQFECGWDRAEISDKGFGFVNDARVGTVRLSQSQLWEEFQKAFKEYEEGNEVSGDWCSLVMFCLDIEWV